MMKRIIYNILLCLFALGLFAYTFIDIFGSSSTVIVIILVFLMLYMFCMWLNTESRKQLKKFYIKHKTTELTEEDCRKILFFAIATHSPIFLIVLLVSFIPMFWMILLIPFSLLISITAKFVFDDYYYLTRKRLPFILALVSVFAVCMLTGTIVMSFFI